MDNKENKKLIGKTSNIIDIVLALTFFIIMAFVLRPFVPMQGEGVVEFWAAFTALPMAGVFWLLIQMFRVTIVDQIRSAKTAE